MFQKTLLTLGLLFTFFTSQSYGVGWDPNKLATLKGTVGTSFSVDLKSLLKTTPTGTLTFSFNVLSPTTPPAFLAIEGTTLKSKTALPTAGTFNFVLSVKEETGGSEPSVDYDRPATLTVLPPPPQFITSDIDLKIQKEGVAWTKDLHDYLAPGSVVTSWGATGLLQSAPWMKLDTATGILSGTPKRIDVGDYSGIQFSPTNDGGTSQASAHGTVLKVLVKPKWVASSFDLGETNEDAQFERDTAQYVLNPENMDLTYAIVDMTPPPWLSVGNKSGTIFGTPTKPGKVDVIVSFSYTVDGSAFSEPATFTLNVKHVNHAPFWLAHPLVISKHASTGKPFSIRLDSSAKDPDVGDTLSYSLISGPAWGKVDATTGELSGTPGKSDFPLSKFIVQVKDQGGLSDQTEVQISVDKSNEPPTWNSHPVVLQPNAKEDELYQQNLQNYATDPDGDALVFTVISGPSWVQVSSSGILTGRPGKNEANKFQKLQISVSDKISTPDDVTEISFFVDHVNHAPVWTANPIESTTKEEDPYSINLSLYAQDADLPNDVLTYGIITGPTWAKLDPASGVLTGTPDHSTVGKNEFVIRVQDKSGLTADTKLVVTVNHKNHPPQWNNPVVLNAKEDTPFTASLKDFVTDIDLPNDALRFVKVSANPAWIQIAADGSVSGTPSKKDVGSMSFEVRVLDIANASDVASIKVVVEHVNHPPTWRPIELAAADEDRTYNYSLKPFAVDPDGDALKFALVSGPKWMFVGEDGTITGVPTSADVGTQHARFRVTDPGGLSAEADADIVVNHTNHPPVISNLPTFDVKERDTLNVDLKQWIKDADGDPLNCTMLSTVEDWVTLNTDCTVTANPMRKHLGSHTFDFKVSDKQLFTFGKLTINVLKNPRNPIWLSEPITPTPLVAKSNVSFSASIKDRAKDLDGDALTFSKVDGPAWLAVSSQGDLSGTPKESDIGEQKATLKVCNTDNLCNTDGGTLLITVKPGIQIDTTQIDTAVPGAPVEYIWDMDYSDHCDKTMRALKNNIQVFYDALNSAQIHHSGVYLSSDVEKFKAQPIRGKDEPILMTWNDGAESANIWRKRTDLAYSSGLCNNCNSSPIWSMYRFLELLPNDPQISKIYHNGYYMPNVPLDTMYVSHQMDHYKHYTKNMAALKNYSPDDFARDFIMFHRKEQKSLRVSVVAPECGNGGTSLIETTEDPSEFGPANAYRIIQTKTGGEYYPTTCNFDAASALSDYAAKVIFRAYVHAKTHIRLSKTPLSTVGMKVSIDGVEIPGGTGGPNDKWSYDAGSNEVVLKWFLIDEGQLKPGDKLLIEYRVS